jgi:hypothetical protein
MYLYGRDVDLLLAWLNGEEEIAFLVSDGEKRWRAVAEVDRLAEGDYMLWHIPTGPLPLLAEQVDGKDGLVDSPWEGWTERRAGADPAVPYFGAGHPGTIRLAVWPNGLPWQRKERSEPIIGLSDFQWIGNRYRIIGHPALPDTERWWKRLKRWTAKVGTIIPRKGPIDGERKEIYAFPEALKAISEGMDRSEL